MINKLLIEQYNEFQSLAEIHKNELEIIENSIEISLLLKQIIRLNKKFHEQVLFQLDNKDII